MTLLRTFAPYPDESGLGYYRRLASANKLVGWRELAQLAQMSTYRTNLFGRPEFLASQLGLESTWTTHASRQEATTRSWKALHRRTVDAICPQCIHEAPYVRNHWAHVFVTACSKHGCHLVERCPACGEWLTSEREHIHACSCGYELSHSKTTPACNTHLWMSALLSSSPVKPEILKIPFTSVEPTSLGLLIRVLCNHADVHSPGPRRNSALPQSVTESIEFIRPLEALLENWPHGFENHVRSRIAAANPEARTLNSSLGTWLKGLKKACAHPSLRPFLDATVRVARETFDGRITGFDVAPDTASAQPFIPLARAANWLGVSRDCLMKAINVGQCQHRAMRFGTRGKTYEVPLDEIQRLERLRKEWMSEEQACNYLGLPASILKNMLQAQILVQDTQWNSDIQKAGAVERASVVALEETIKRYMQPRTVNEPIVQWIELTSRRMGEKSAIQSAMRAAARGEIRAIQIGPKLCDAKFALDDIKRFFGAPVLDAGMSVQQLSENTGWKWESIAHWIDLGLLHCEQIQLRGQPCKVVSPMHLLEFRRSYIPLSDLARAMGTRSSTLIDRLSGIDIIGAKLEPNGARRGGLVRIEDLGRLAVSGLAASRGSLFGQQMLL